MRKQNLLLIALLATIIFITCYVFYTNENTIKIEKKIVKEDKEKILELKRLQAKAATIKPYLKNNKYNTYVCFLIDMQMPGNKKRFFVFDLRADTVLYKGLVAHGSCNTTFLENVRFSNTPDCGCSAIGKYKVGYKYKGQFGNAYKLYGLDSSNSNAFNRFIVLHSYNCVGDEETNTVVCNSLGCPMVSITFLQKLSMKIDKSKQPIMLWMFQ